MPFLDANVELGMPRNNNFQVGDTDVDSGLIVERDVHIPFVPRPEASWLYFDCTIGVMLDSGIVVHNRLPQVNRTSDTLATSSLDNETLDEFTDFGVNLRCNDQYKDIVQRMGHARYWFRIWGRALRIGFQVPIPGIKKIGGVPTIPYDKNPQWAYNSMVSGGNYGGAILWRAEWSLWYTTITQPLGQLGGNEIPAADPSAHISSKAPLVRRMQSPYAQPDDDSVPAPVGNAGAAVGGAAAGVLGGVAGRGQGR